MAPLLAWACLAASFVVAFAAAVRMAWPTPAGPHVSGVIRLPEPVTLGIIVLFALAVLVFVVDLARRALSSRAMKTAGGPPVEPTRVPPWLRRLSLILSLLNVAVLAYLWRRAALEGGFLLGGGLVAGLALPETVPLSAPAVFNWVFGILALAAGLGALVLALWVALGDRLNRTDEEGTGEASPASLAAVEESLEDLRSEPDLRRAIVRCYARFERVAADSGLARKPWLTPMEFMREVLARGRAPHPALPTLTGLFELARFSHHTLGPPERDRALEALHEIRTAMEPRGDDAGSR